MGKLVVMSPVKPEVHPFNGELADRQRVEEIFRDLMNGGGFLAFQVEAPERGGKPTKTQIRADEFPVNDPHAEVVLTPHLAGG